MAPGDTTVGSTPTWWKNLSARLDAGPAALHRLPKTVAHIAEALWMQALDEGRRRAQQELKTYERQAADQHQHLEVRSHVLTLREGELDSCLRDRERTIEDLNLGLRELAGALRKEQATRELLAKRPARPAPQIFARRQARTNPRKSKTPPTPKRKPTARRAGPLRKSTKRKTSKRSAVGLKKSKRG